MPHFTNTTLPAYRVAAKPGGFEVLQPGDYWALMSCAEEVKLANEHTLHGRIWIRSKLTRTAKQLDPGVETLSIIVGVQRIPPKEQSNLYWQMYSEACEATTGQAIQNWLMSLLPDIRDELGLTTWEDRARTFKLLNQLDMHCIFLDTILKIQQQLREQALLPVRHKFLPPPQ